MQKPIKVDDSYSFERLEKYLSDGWVVVGMCPMPSSTSVSSGGGNFSSSASSKISPTCLVIIEKKETNNAH